MCVNLLPEHLHRFFVFHGCLFMFIQIFILENENMLYSWSLKSRILKANSMWQDFHRLPFLPRGAYCTSWLASSTPFACSGLGASSDTLYCVPWWRRRLEGAVSSGALDAPEVGLIKEWSTRHHCTAHVSNLSVIQPRARYPERMLKYWRILTVLQGLWRIETITPTVLRLYTQKGFQSPSALYTL